MSTRAQQNEPDLWLPSTMTIAAAMPRAHSRSFSGFDARAQPRVAERMTSLAGCSAFQFARPARLTDWEFSYTKRLVRQHAAQGSGGGAGAGAGLQ